MSRLAGSRHGFSNPDALPFVFCLTAVNLLFFLLPYSLPCSGDLHSNRPKQLCQQVSARP